MLLRDEAERRPKRRPLRKTSRFLHLVSLSLIALAGACGQIATSPLPSSVVTLPADFYHPANPSGEKIPLSALMVTDPAFGARTYTATDTGRVYHIQLQPALDSALTRLLSDTFSSARLSRNGESAADLSGAQIIVHPAVNLGLSFSQNVFSETITVIATLYLVTSSPRNSSELAQFQRQASASAVGGAPWDVGGYYTGFRAGGDNRKIIAELLASALSADLDRLGEDLRRAALEERLARAQARRPPPPDQIVPEIPYVPNTMQGVAGAQP
jgi:hypothetical protein